MTGKHTLTQLHDQPPSASVQVKSFFSVTCLQLRPSRQLNDVTLWPPATDPTHKHHFFSSVRPRRSHVSYRRAAGARFPFCAAPILDCWQDFYKVIRWCLTHDFDQTARRACAASTATSTAFKWVCVSSCFCIIATKPISLKYAQKYV